MLALGCVNWNHPRGCGSQKVGPRNLGQTFIIINTQLNVLLYKHSISTLEVGRRRDNKGSAPLGKSVVSVCLSVGLMELQDLIEGERGRNDVILWPQSSSSSSLVLGISRFCLMPPKISNKNIFTITRNIQTAGKPNRAHIYLLKKVELLLQLPLPLGSL